MMKIQHNTAALIGDTPMVRLSRICKKYECKAEVLMKLEYFNPASSIKDRVAKAMVDDAEKRKIIKPHANPPYTLVEATSGNTGIGLAFIAITRGYKLIIAMPENMSEERKKLLVGMGAELVLTPAAEGVSGAEKEVDRIVAQTANAVKMGQFSNPANTDAHYKGTAPEIWQQCRGKIDYFLTGIGTGGTITGVGKYLKECSKKIKILGVEPAESPLLSEGRSGPHLIQGIGPNIIPDLLDRSLIDKIIPVPSEKAIETARDLIKEEGILCGISSGANAYAALELAKRPDMLGKRIVCIACDGADRYLSTKLFE